MLLRMLMNRVCGEIPITTVSPPSKCLAHGHGWEEGKLRHCGSPSSPAHAAAQCSVLMVPPVWHEGVYGEGSGRDQCVQPNLGGSGLGGSWV